MSKDPAFLLYYQDFMWGTRLFTKEQRGLYIELLCEQADSETGSISEKHMINICYLCEEQTKNIVLEKFVKDDNGWYNKKQRELIEKRRNYCDSRAVNRIGKTKKIRKTYVKHMEDENEIVNIDFNVFWNLYEYKVGSKKKCEKKWNKLTDEDRTKIIDTLPQFLSKIREKKFQPYPETYLNNERWYDEQPKEIKIMVL